MRFSTSSGTNTAELVWLPFWTLTRKEVRRFLRVIGQTILIPLVNSSLYLLIFGVSLGSKIQTSTPWSYLAFLIPGLVMMGVLNSAFQNTSSSIATSKFHGDLEDLKRSPLTPLQIVGAMSLAGLIRGVLVGTITFSIGEIFYFLTEGSPLPVAHPFILFLFVILGGLSFSSLGIMCAFWAKSIDQLSTVGGFILLPLIYLGGVFFSIENLHPFWQSLSKANPLLYFINGMRYGILGRADISWELAAAVSVLALVGMILGALHTVRTGSFHRW